MIQHGFKEAYANKVGQQNKGISTIANGVKDTATLIGGALSGVGAVGAMGGATGGLASFAQSMAGKMALQNIAGRIGGLGGNLLATQMTQRIDTVTVRKEEEELRRTDINKATDIDRMKQAKADVNKDIKESGGLSQAQRKVFNTVYAKLMQTTMERDMVGRLAKSYAKQEVTNDSDK